MTTDTNNIIPIHIRSGADAMPAGSWYDNAYYQILLVEPNPHPTPGQLISTKIVAGKRKSSEGNVIDFSKYKLDETTKNRLNSYPKPPDFSENNINIGTYLPSPGVVFPEGFIKALSRKNGMTPDINSYHNYSIEVNNFYDPIRTMLHTRKTSQLIAKTWWAYLTAKTHIVKREEPNEPEKKINLWECFLNGKWDQLPKAEQDILDSLIAREIFLTHPNSAPDTLEPNDLDIYYPLKSQSQGKETRFLILPNSKAWQGIALSLLLSGQAYYRSDNNGNYSSDGEYYHQISQPILSTGEIVMKYGLEVSWNQFHGDIIEMSLSPASNSIAYQAIIPYPPIPSENNLSIEHIKAWADAEDDPNPNTKLKIPFYHKTDQENYCVDVLYFSPPYPYLPLSCS